MSSAFRITCHKDEGGPETGHQETIRDARAKMATIESIGELVEIKLASGPSSPVKRAVNHGLRIINSGIDSPEHVRCVWIVTESDFVVRVMGFRCGGIGGTRPCPCARRPKTLPGGLIPQQWSYSLGRGRLPKRQTEDDHGKHQRRPGPSAWFPLSRS